MTVNLVLRGGTVFDGHRYRPDLSAVAVSDGRIVAVGGDDIAGPAGPGTRVVDVAGGLILPGFIDAHVHPVEAGIELARCDLAGLVTKDAVLDRIAEYAAEHPAEEWILGGGWQMATFPGGTPLASDLDRIVPDRPVYLPNRDHHGAWVNSRALELAAISRDTPDPVDGRIERDADGNPTGTLHEGAAALVKRIVPVDTEDDQYAGLLSAQKLLHSVGVTGWQDAIVGNYGGHADTRAVYQRAADAGDLVSRVVAALWWERDRGLEQLDELRAKRAAHSGERFRATSIKIMEDGVPENHTAAVGDPYLPTGCRCVGDHRGIEFVEKDALADIVTVLDADDWQVHIHAIGDRAIRDSLSAFERALAHNGRNDLRHHIAHVQIVDPADIPRFAALGVTANIQTLWASNEPQMVELNLPALGPQRSAWQYPFGSFVRAGVSLASGSDWPVTSPDPWRAIHVAVNRLLPASDPDFSPDVFYPEQAMTLETALASYTSGSARINHDDDAGRIEVGARADIVVTDRNAFAFTPLEVGDTRVVATYIGGTEVFAQ